MRSALQSRSAPRSHWRQDTACSIREIVCANREGLAVKLGNLAGISTLRGAHNAQNALAAVSAVREALERAGHAERTSIGKVRCHRSAALRIAWKKSAISGRVLFINDSKATNADSTEKALLAFPRDVFWIVGGKPKDGGIESLRPTTSQGIVRAYLIGAASERDFSQTLDGDAAIIPCGTLDVAVARAAADAAAYARGEAMMLYNVQGSMGVGTLVPGTASTPIGLKGRRAGRAAVARVRELRPIQKFRSPRRRLPRSSSQSSPASRCGAPHELQPR